jgi:YVTN family beta-propeller protein
MALLCVGANAYAVPPANLDVIATVAVGSRPLDMTLSPDGSRLYVVNNGPGGATNQGRISVVDTSTFSVITTTNPLGLGFPFEMGISPSSARGYLAVSKFSGATTTGADRVLIFDTVTDTIVGSIPITGSPSLPNGTGPIGVALTPDGSRAYVTARLEDRVYVINTITSSVMGGIAVGDRPVGITVSPNGTRVYVANGLNATVSVINTSTNTVINTIAFGSGTSASRTRIALTPDGKRAYITADNTVGNIAIIDTDPTSANFELQIALLITSGSGLRGAAVSPDGKFLYVASAGTNQLLVFDADATSPTYHTQLSAVSVIAPAGVVAPTSATVAAYVSNPDEGTVSVIGCSDSDGDAICDANDNCPHDVNADQIDTDSDGLGDLCDPATELHSVKDSFLRAGAANTNEGANPALRLQASGHNRVIIAFDLTGIDTARVISATLILTIIENADNWGQDNNRTVEAHPLLGDFSEGNGKNTEVPGAEATRGGGPGVTWACATDNEIANHKADCNPMWNGGTFGMATALPVVHVNDQLGEVHWDVTADVVAGATGWVIKKTNEGQSGQVTYSSKEGTEPPLLLLTLE